MSSASSRYAVNMDFPDPGKHGACGEPKDHMKGMAPGPRETDPEGRKHAGMQELARQIS